MDLRIYYQDKKYIFLPYYSTSDPSALPVKMAIKPKGTPALPVDLVAAEWVPGETWSATAGRNMRLLIGPGSTFGALTPGIYCMYGAVDDNPEDPFEPASNYLVIYDTP